jgi:hypothetical protein
MNTRVTDAPASQQVLDAAPAASGALRVAPAQPVARLDPAALLQIAVERGDSIEVLTKLMDLKDRFDAKMALEGFNKDFTAFKAEAVALIRNKLITDGPLKNKKHAELSDAVNAATPALSRHGLSVSWNVEQDRATRAITVTCMVRHILGHSESVSMTGDPDTGPGRNSLQAIGSTKTYLERYTYTAILGLAAQDADDDGAAGGQTTSAETALLVRLIGEAQMTETGEAALAFWKARAKELAAWPYAYEKFKQAVAAHRKTLDKSAVAA